MDPGLATGTAIYDLETCTFVRMDETPLGIRGFTRPFKALYNAVLEVDHIACEGFTLRSSNKFTADLSGVEIIGWLKGQQYEVTYPEPSQHMTLTRLRKNKDDYAESPVTKLMKSQGFKIGAGHSRMAGSVAIWYAAKILNHRPTLELLKPREV